MDSGELRFNEILTLSKSTKLLVYKVKWLLFIFRFGGMLLLVYEIGGGGIFDMMFAIEVSLVACWVCIRRLWVPNLMIGLHIAAHLHIQIQSY